MTSADSARAEIMINAPTMAVGQVEVDGVGQACMPALDGDPVHIQLGVEKIIIDQVRIERELFGVLIPNVDLPIIFCLQLADAETALIGVALAAVARLAGGFGAIVGLEIGREIAEYPHRQFARFSSRLPWAYRKPADC